MAKIGATDSVFINCPFDRDYWPLLEVVVFTTLACGFVPRTALEEADGGEPRLDKILRLVRSSRYGIHDISCVALDGNDLPRFNMPFELGLDIACRRFGGTEHARKRILILEETKYTYQRCLSDIAGQDTQAHSRDPAKLLKIVRDWLVVVSRRTATIPGAVAIQSQFEKFSTSLPGLCAASGLDRTDLLFLDYLALAKTWLAEANYTPIDGA